MPELPEIETIKRGLSSLLEQKIINATVRQYKLRYQIIDNFQTQIINKYINNIHRRARIFMNA